MGAMKFHSQYQAKQFFIDKVIVQAERNNIPLSEAERYMLKWTEVEEGFVVEQDMLDMYNEETTNEEFETKVKGLLANVFSFDTKGNRNMLESYGNAYNAIKDHDHYILVMINETIGRHLGSSGEDFIKNVLNALNIKRMPTIPDSLLLIIAALFCFALLFFSMFFIKGEIWLSDEWATFTLGSITYICTFNYSIRKSQRSPYELSFFRKSGSDLPLLLKLAFNIIPIVLIAILIHYQLLEIPKVNDREPGFIITIQLFAGPALGFTAAYYYDSFLARIVFKD